MPSKPSTLDDNLIPALETPKAKKGSQEDGTYITSTGKVLPAKNKNNREPYPEPEELAHTGATFVVESSDGSISFEATRLADDEFNRRGGLSRKRQPLRWKTTEVYTKIKPRPFYSYDELEQIKKGELKR